MATATCWMERVTASARSLDTRILGPTGGQSVGATILGVYASGAVSQRRRPAESYREGFRSAFIAVSFAGCLAVSVMVMMIEYALLGLMTLLLHPFRGP